MKKVISIVVFLLLMQGISNAQNRAIDSLKTLLKTDKEDTNKVNHLNNISWELRNSKPDTSIILCNQALSISEKLRWKKGITNSLGNLGSYFRLKDDYSKALFYFFKALEIDQGLENKNGIGRHLGNISLVYWNQGNYVMALDYNLKALKIFEELGHKNNIARSLANIGILYSEQADHNKALDYYLRALKINEELGNKSNIAKLLGNIGNIYHNQGDNPKALDYHLKALSLNEELGNKNEVAINLGNIGNVYSKESDYFKALDYHFKALKLDSAAKNTNGIGRHLGNIGLLYIKIEKHKEAYICLYRSLAISNSIGAPNIMQQNYKDLSELYATSTILLPDSFGGNILNKEEMRLRALHYYKRHISLRDSIFSEENKKQLVRKEMNFDFEKKEAATKAEQNKKDAVTKIILYSITGGLFLVLLLAAFIFRGYKQKQKANIIITEQKRLVDEHQKEILDSIKYAKRIQSAHLPTEKYIAKNIDRLKK